MDKNKKFIIVLISLLAVILCLAVLNGGEFDKKTTDNNVNNTTSVSNVTNTTNETNTVNNTANGVNKTAPAKSWKSLGSYKGNTCKRIWIRLMGIQ